MIYQDNDPETGFVLLPDFKWDQKELQNLYLLAICRKKGILSLRELGRGHLPLLKNILEKGKVRLTPCASSMYSILYISNLTVQIPYTIACMVPKLYSCYIGGINSLRTLIFMYIY